MWPLPAFDLYSRNGKLNDLKNSLKIPVINGKKIVRNTSGSFPATAGRSTESKDAVHNHAPGR